MEDVTDGISYAWRGAVKSMKSGYKLTKRAMQNLPMERLKLMRAHHHENDMKTNQASHRHHSVRHMFKLRFHTHSSSLGNPSRHSAKEHGSLSKEQLSHREFEYENDEDDENQDDEDESILEEEEEEEPLTDEQIHELVEDKYFDKSYDAARYELSQLQVTYSDSEEESKAERAIAELRLLELRQLCEIVSSTLKRRVLARHREFMSGVLRIREMNDALLLTSSESKKTGSAIRRAKQNVMGQIHLLSQHRRNVNVHSTLLLMTAMKELCVNRTQLYALLASGKLVDAALFLQRQQKQIVEPSYSSSSFSTSTGTQNNYSKSYLNSETLAKLRKVHSINEMVDEWQSYCSNSINKLRLSFEVLLTSNLTNKFIPSTYRNVMESIPFFFPINTNVYKAGTTQGTYNSSNNNKETISSMCALIASLLWRTAVRILTKSLAEVSLVKDEESSLVDIVNGIQSDHLLVCLCQMSAKLMDFVFFYNQLIHLHEEEVRLSDKDSNNTGVIHDYYLESLEESSLLHNTATILDHCNSTKTNRNDSNNNNNINQKEKEIEYWVPAMTTSEMHTRALQAVRDIGHRIATDLVSKITLILTSAPFATIDVDRLLHIFVLMSMLNGGIAILHGNDKEEEAHALHSIYVVVHRYMRILFQSNKLKEIMTFMEEDTWELTTIDPWTLSVVKPLSASHYEHLIHEVTDYVHRESKTISEANESELEESTNSVSKKNVTAVTSTMINMKHKITCFGAAEAENPFYSLDMLIPPDLSQHIHTFTFNEYWSKHANDILLSASASATVTPEKQTNPTIMNNNRSVNGSTRESTEQPLTLAFTSSGLTVTNVLLEYQARIAIRYPPLASAILDWSYDMVVFYTYSVFENFVSISRSVALEHQGGFAMEVQHSIELLRSRAEHVYDESVNLNETSNYNSSSNRLDMTNSSSSIAVNNNNSTVITNSKNTESVNGLRAKTSTNTTNSNSLSLSNSSSSTTTIMANTDLMNSNSSPLLIARKFPTRLSYTTRTELSSVELCYGLDKRVNALLSCWSLVFFYRAAISSSSPLLSVRLVQSHEQQANMLEHIIKEVVHVTLHRLCLAICPMEGVIEMIGKMKANKNEMKASGYVTEIMKNVTMVNKKRPSFAKFPHMEKLLLQRLIFAIQTILLREYAKLGRKRVSDVLVMQLQVDVQTLQQQLVSAFGKIGLVMPEYVLAFIKTGFYHDNRTELLVWLRQHHTLYSAADLLNWLSNGDRAFKLQLQDVLVNELGHTEDIIPIDHFIAL